MGLYPKLNQMIKNIQLLIKTWIYLFRVLDNNKNILII